MVATRTDYDHLVTHVFCAPCMLSVQISTLSPRYVDLLIASLGFHSACETTGQPHWEDLEEVASYKRVMNEARAHVGLPALP